MTPSEREALVAKARTFGKPGWSHSFADCFRMIADLADALEASSPAPGWKLEGATHPVTPADRAKHQQASQWFVPPPPGSEGEAK